MAEEKKQDTVETRPEAQSDTNKLLAAIGYPIWIVALIMILTDPGKKDPFVKYHAWQAIIYDIAYYIVGFVLLFVFGLGMFVWFVGWLVSIWFAVQAYQGKYFEVPVIYGFAKKYMEGEAD